MQIGVFVTGLPTTQARQGRYDMDLKRAVKNRLPFAPIRIIQKRLYTDRFNIVKCASHEAETRRYHKVIGKSGKTWLYADQENPADNLYVEGEKGNDGFSGRTLVFKLVDGGKVELKGPWHANSGAFFQDTGIDTMNKYLTYAVVGLGRGGVYKSYIKDVIYKDKEPAVGEFNRGQKIAQSLANKVGGQVYCFVKTSGGSSCEAICPEIRHGGKDSNGY